jgi:hypothetical protein
MPVRREDPRPFERVLQCGIENLGYASRIALLRGYYFDDAPELAPYLMSVPEAQRLNAQGLWAGRDDALPVVSLGPRGLGAPPFRRTRQPHNPDRDLIDHGVLVLELADSPAPSRAGPRSAHACPCLVMKGSPVRVRASALKRGPAESHSRVDADPCQRGRYAARKALTPASAYRLSSRRRGMRSLPSIIA